MCHVRLSRAPGDGAKPAAAVAAVAAPTLMAWSYGRCSRGLRLALAGQPALRRCMAVVPAARGVRGAWQRMTAPVCGGLRQRIGHYVASLPDSMQSSITVSFRYKWRGRLMYRVALCAEVVALCRWGRARVGYHHGRGHRSKGTTTGSGSMVDHSLQMSGEAGDHCHQSITHSRPCARDLSADRIQQRHAQQLAAPHSAVLLQVRMAMPCE